MTEFKMTREIRNAIRAAVTNAPGWHGWRATNLANPDGSIRDAGSMLKHEILLAADALGIDPLAVAKTVETEPTLPLEAPHVEPVENIAAPMGDMAHDFAGRDIAELIRDALAPAEGMVGPKLFDMLAASVAPLATAAAAGPRVIRETIAVNADGETVQPATRHCRIVAKRNARELFGLAPNECGTWRDALEKPLSVWDGTGADGVPLRDPHHVWDAEALAFLSIAARNADEGKALRNLSRVLLFGPAGTGKTSSVAQFAAMTNRPFVRLAFDRTTEPAELIGQRMPKLGGGTEFREGALVSAMQVPGCVILLDEPSFLRPGAAAVLQTILDIGAIYLKEDGNRRVDLAPGVIICAADNTNLTGDETGRYADTMAQNLALQDRFAWLVRCSYLTPEREAAVIQARTGLNGEAARMMADFAQSSRLVADAGQMTTGLSLRRLISWAVAVHAGVTSEHAFAAAILKAADVADRETIRGLEKATAMHPAIDAHAKGLPLPAAPQATTPQGQAAAAAFQAA